MPTEHACQVVDYRGSSLCNQPGSVGRAQLGAFDKTPDSPFHGAHHLCDGRALYQIQYPDCLVQALGGEPQGRGIQRGQVAAAGGFSLAAELDELCAHAIEGFAQGTHHP